MATMPGRTPRGLEWLRDLGVGEQELPGLNPCVPGEFTVADTYYVNTGSPRIIYLGSEEGTLPMVAGRWYILPGDLVERHGALRRDAVPVARAVQLIR